jgi:hypothetical protein
MSDQTCAKCGEGIPEDKPMWYAYDNSGPYCGKCWEQRAQKGNER